MARVLRRCQAERLAEGEFSGGRRERCKAAAWSDGNVVNTCGEPCSFMMHDQPSPLELAAARAIDALRRHGDEETARLLERAIGAQSGR